MSTKENRYDLKNKNPGQRPGFLNKPNLVNFKGMLLILLSPQINYATRLIN